MSTLLRFAAAPVMPWKNSAGRTREIHISPDTSGPDDFLWRLSLAEIDGCAPFSAFPGVDRQFLRASPGRLRLEIGPKIHDLGFRDVAGFPGEADVAVTVVEGPSLNLNLMTRRGHCTGGITVGNHHGPVRFEAPETAAVVLLAGAARLAPGTELERYDTVVTDGRPCALDCTGAVLAVVAIAGMP